MLFENVTAETLRQFAPLSGEASRIETLAGAAFEYIEQYTGRKLERARRIEQHPAQSCILLQAWPVQSVESVSIDGAAIDAGDIAVDAERGIITLNRLPAGQMAEVTYTGGYTSETLPGPILTACAMLVSGMLSAGQNGGQQITQQMLDGYQVTYQSRYAGGGELESLSPSAAILLKPYRSRQAMR